MVRLNDESGEKSTGAAQAAVSEAVFHASELHGEPLVEQHFGGLSEHMHEDSVEGFLARAAAVIREHPWAAAGTALAVGMLLGMLTAPLAAKPIRAIRRRRSAGGRRSEQRNTLQDEPRSMEDAAYMSQGSQGNADNLSGL